MTQLILLGLFIAEIAVDLLAVRVVVRRSGAHASDAKLPEQVVGSLGFMHVLAPLAPAQGLRGERVRHLDGERQLFVSSHYSSSPDVFSWSKSCSSGFSISGSLS